jgi:hypothetical protein
VGSAEVFDGAGRFAGNAMDMRHVQSLGDGSTRIDVTFVGPFKMAGHYMIEHHDTHRQYLGPANIGYAETLGDELVDVNAYWPALGMTQRLFLMVLPEHNIQLSLAQMMRGDQIMYTVVGENQRVEDANAQPQIVSGAACDLASDPTAGRGACLLHRAGTWQGTLSVLNAARECIGTSQYSEAMTPDANSLDVRIDTEMTAHVARPFTLPITLTTNHWQAWTTGSGPIVGSYNLAGGRALSGTFAALGLDWRVWRREVVSHDGTRKAVVHHWYRGYERLAVHYGLLDFVEVS